MRAARLVARTFGDAKVDADQELSAWLVAAAQLANRLVYDSGQASPAGGQAASLVAAAFLGKKVALVHVGGAQAYFCRGGEVEKLTRDHTLVGMLVEHQGLSPEQAAAQVEPGILSRALGLDHEVRVDLIGPFELEPGDRFVLCSAGAAEHLRLTDLRGKVKRTAQAEADALGEVVMGRSAGQGGGVITVRAGPHAGPCMEPTPVPEVERIADMLTPSTADLQLVAGLTEKELGVPSATSTAMGKAREVGPEPVALKRSQDRLLILAVVGMLVICVLLASALILL